MKKTINNRFLISSSLFALSFFAFSCNSGNEKKEIHTQALLDSVETLIGIGKVVPEEGWVNIMSAQSGTLREIRVKKGDSVKKNQTLFVLGSSDLQADLNLQTLELAELKAQQASETEQLQIENAELSKLRKIFETSQYLSAKNAETAEKVKSDSIAVVQQIAKIAALEKDREASQLSQRVKQSVVQESRGKVNDLEVKAVQEGILTEIEAEVGDFINNQTLLAQMVPSQNVIIEAEVDEMLADKVLIGQSVEFRKVGTREIMGKGTITYVSPILSNKSILYESLNEGDDRRVLRIRVQPENSKGLFINSKVECLIHLN